MDKGWYVRFLFVVATVVAGWLVLWPSVDKWVPAVNEYINRVGGK